MSDSDLPNGRSEEIPGRALEGRRDDVVVTTKVDLPTGMGLEERGLGRELVLHKLKMSLRHLRNGRGSWRLAIAVREARW